MQDFLSSSGTDVGGLYANVTDLTSILEQAIELYLKDKSFLPRQQVQEQVQTRFKGYLQYKENHGLFSRMGSKQGRNAFSNLRFVVEIANKHQQGRWVFVSARQSLVNFLTSGFIHLVFRSKLFWGLDKHWWHLGYYKIRIFVVNHEVDLLRADWQGQLEELAQVGGIIGGLVKTAGEDNAHSAGRGHKSVLRATKKPKNNNSAISWYAGVPIVYGQLLSGLGVLITKLKTSPWLNLQGLNLQKAFFQNLWVGW